MVLIIFLILNLVLFALRKITAGVFWVVIIVIAVMAWKVVPRIRTGARVKLVKNEMQKHTEKKE